MIITGRVMDGHIMITGRTGGWTYMIITSRIVDGQFIIITGRIVDGHI